MHRFGSDSASSHFMRCTEYHKCNQSKQGVTTVKLKNCVISVLDIQNRMAVRYESGSVTTLSEFGQKYAAQDAL